MARKTPHSGDERASDEDDLSLFAQAMRDVTRHTPARSVPARPLPDPTPHQRLRDDASVLAESMADIPDDILIAAGDVLEYRVAGITDSVYRRLRRGNFHIRDELDLHGLNSRDAKLAVQAFLNRCRAADQRCVRIIHGKGLRSTGDGPVLKRRLDGWLRQRSDVLAFSSARREHGGAGAVYVLLRKLD